MSHNKGPNSELDILKQSDEWQSESQKAREKGKMEFLCLCNSDKRVDPRTRFNYHFLIDVVPCKINTNTKNHP